MGSLFSKCPSCDSEELFVAKIECADCETKFEGKFDIPKLQKLSPQELEFVFQFIKCSGSLKEMAKIKGISYPTLRNQLNQIIEVIDRLYTDTYSSKEAILNQLENGEISAKDAAKKLREIRS